MARRRPPRPRARRSRGRRGRELRARVSRSLLARDPDRPRTAGAPPLRPLFSGAGGGGTPHLLPLRVRFRPRGGEFARRRARTVAVARHPPIDPRARVPPRPGTRPGGPLSRSQYRSRARGDPDDLYRAGVELGPFLLSVSRVGPGAAPGGVPPLRVAPLADVPPARSARRRPGPDLERHALDGRRGVLPHGERIVPPGSPRLPAPGNRR